MKSDKRKQQYKQLGLAVAYYRKMHGLTPVSYTQLDVYKRQIQHHPASGVHFVELLFQTS